MSEIKKDCPVLKLKIGIGVGGELYQACKTCLNRTAPDYEALAREVQALAKAGERSTFQDGYESGITDAAEFIRRKAGK